MTRSEFFGGHIPEYIIEASDRSITILLDTGNTITVTPDEVAEYVLTPQSMSGIRSFAGAIGDWRYMDDLAAMCLHYFQTFNFSSMEEALACLRISQNQSL